jgi:photosystem II stability/assembly factor-like uncharacterized protein
MKKERVVLTIMWLFLSAGVLAQAQVEESAYSRFNAKTFAGLRFRGIGPALMSGRIADIAIHPEDTSLWYVAVGSGGVWKTSNAGTTWQPIFDDYDSYSIGCVTVDPNFHDVIWVGTGENVSGRHVGYGDGVYRSLDGGKTFINMGLKESFMIARILVDPRDSRVVYVAAEGNQWVPGGERGVYKSTNGGESWDRCLEIGEDTGVTEVAFEPGNPDIIYAAAYQRRRSVAAFLAGGPESGIYKSMDAGASWRKLKKGLPGGDIGKIGLAVSPIKPSVVYAVIEKSAGEGGFFRSADRGESWTKMSDYNAGGTGPHYYHELYADPHHFDRVYAADVRLKVTDDGGKTVRDVGERWKHVDNHAVVFHPRDPDYLLVGCDGGLYESWDQGGNWKFIANLPVTQFYKLSLDDDVPFYNVVGGTQDNSTQYGPSRTLTRHGIRNSDWRIIWGGDGHGPAMDKQDPSFVYVQSQQANLGRWDRESGESVSITALPGEGEAPLRPNWDAPILVSPHDSRTLFHGFQKLYRSDDRGLSWTAISPDLSRGIDRYSVPIMGRVQSIDALWYHRAMSQYGNITALSESPLRRGLLYVGTDDGLIHVTEDGGQNWVKTDQIPGVPDTAFVNQVMASVTDVNTVFAVMDHHKSGDYKPYVVKSIDRGRTWQLISGDLPDRHIVWSIEQDHQRPDLLFVGTEFGIFFTIDGGEHWVKLKGGVPTIPFRDLEIQQRENDLVGASFGRGFYVLDDYSPLREMTADLLDEEAHLFPVKKALLYVETSPLGGGEKGTQGGAFFTAPNPPFGATITYYLRDSYRTIKEARLHEEGRLDTDVPFPGWDQLKQEEREEAPLVLLVVKDEEGEEISRIKGPITAGVHRVNWNLRYDSYRPGVEPSGRGGRPGPLVVSGTYTVRLYKYVSGELAQLGESQAFEVESLGLARLPAPDQKEKQAFEREVGRLQKALAGASGSLADAIERLNGLKEAVLETPGGDLQLRQRALDIETRLKDLQERLTGDPVKRRRQVPIPPSISSRVQTALYRSLNSTAPVSGTQRQNYDLAARAFGEVLRELKVLIETDLVELEGDADRTGVPWTKGRRLPDWQP